MRFFGTQETPVAPVVPDSVVTLMFTSAATTFNYPTGTHLIRASVCSTLGADLSGVLNPNSSGAAWATSASGTAGSTTANVLVGASPKMFQVAGVSGGSAVGSSNGVMTLECWSRSATTG